MRTNPYSKSCVDVETQFVSVPCGDRFAYRVTGEESNVPIVLFNHLAGVLDDWDPAVVDGIAAKHRVITFDNRGIGGSQGATPRSVGEMADDAIAFIKALGHSKVDLFGFSLGGAVAQDVVLKEPNLARKLILAGTGPGGGIGITRIPGQAYRNQLRSMMTRKDIRRYLFFTKTKNGLQKATEFLARLKRRKHDRVKPISFKSFRSQLAAISRFGKRSELDWQRIEQPVLVANGEDDIMVPSINSAHLYLGLPDAKLVLYKDAGHAGVFQYHEEFVSEALRFLSD
ncbi:MAG: alpha/beta hydrolase [Leptolyngbya sp. SIOISBB]|nr:alpha/beta hydrolase [Leptolyngbya sp. SIOISBB]